MLQQKSHKQRIGLVAGTILIVVVILVGVSIFYIMARHAERLLSSNLQSSLSNNLNLTGLEIREGFARGLTVATRPFLIDQLERVNTQEGDDTTRTALKRGAESFLSTGLSAVALYDKNGQEVARAGIFKQQSTLTVPIHFAAGQAQLLFKDKYLLRTQVNIVKAGQVVGKAISEMPLPTLTSLFSGVKSLGGTSELALCAAADTMNMRCFPPTLNPIVMTVPKRSLNGVPLPMAYALEGKTGFIRALDYRQQQVVAAYGPVSDFGLGMVLKMDSSELYAPIRNQLRYLLPLMVGMLGVALLLLRWQLTPLVTGLVSSERRAREALTQLQNSENRVQVVLDNVEEGIVTLSSVGTIELFNLGAERLFGYRSHEVTGKSMSLLMPEPHGREHDEYLGRYLQTGQSSVMGVAREVGGLRRDGGVFPMELRISEFYQNGHRRFIGTMRDITQRKETEAKIIHLAHFDALTDLPNRRLVQDRIQQAIVGAERTGSEFVVLFIDLDNFKSINDTLGHDAGDRLLERVACRITESLRAQDTVGRQGGDEFIVLLASISTAADSARVAQKILDALSVPFEINGHTLHSSASIGIAVYPHDGIDVETLLKNSDTAMYSAKETGRNNYQFFTEAMNGAAAERLLVESSLREGIERTELLLHYQPLVSIASGRIVATEALVRWDHPQLGRMEPARFIPVAENSGLIVPLGEWALRQACLQLMQWREQGLQAPRMVINLSPRQFRQKYLLRNFYRVLSETGVDPHWLGLEITENVIMDNPEIAIGVLKQLKTLGFELSLDDFGTGYSSLSYLKRLPIDKLKIDQTFIRDITIDADDEAMVAAIIVMAHQLNIKVVAEGVETEGQLAFLREHGCDEYQGFYFSPPQSPEDLYANFKASMGQI